jgi:hypothetical protein
VILQASSALSVSKVTEKAARDVRRHGLPSARGSYRAARI